MAIKFQVRQSYMLMFYRIIALSLVGHFHRHIRFLDCSGFLKNRKLDE